MNKRSFYTLIPAILFVCLLYHSCIKDVGKPSEALITLPAGACDSATYTFKIKAIIDTKCVTCHNPTDAPKHANTDLSTYDLVKTKADAGRILARVIKADPSIMPPVIGGVPLTYDEKKLIQCWLDKKAPQ